MRGRWETWIMDKGGAGPKKVEKHCSNQILHEVEEFLKPTIFIASIITFTILQDRQRRLQSATCGSGAAGCRSLIQAPLLCASLRHALGALDTMLPTGMSGVKGERLQWKARAKLLHQVPSVHQFIIRHQKPKDSSTQEPREDKNWI